MTRRRLPVRKTSSSSNSNRRNADTKNLITAQVFGGLEIAGFLRAILLGAFVGALVIFLFYPDISSLLQRWQNSSSQEQVLRLAGGEKKEGESGKLRSADVNKEEENVRHPPNQAKSKARTPEEKTTAKRAKKDRDRGEEVSNSACPTCECPCNDPDDPRKPQPKKPKRTPKEDLMEEEETVEEEDSVELELLEEEEEEPGKFTVLDSEEDSTSKSSKSESGPAEEKGPSSKDVPPTPHQREVSGNSPSNPPGTADPEEEEPLVLTDGQPITFTPVSAGDEQFLHMGGRPTPTKEASREAKTKTSNHDPTKQNTSTKSNKANQEKATKNKEQKKKPSPTKQESGSQKKPSGKASGKEEEGKRSDPLEEVKKFKPTFLKTVAAKKIFADGRRIPPVELLPQKETNSSVRVFLFNEFLSEMECDGLRRVHDIHVQERSSKPLLCFDSLRTFRKHLSDVKVDIHVTPHDFVEGTKCLNASFSRRLESWMGGNWSYSTAFYPGESRFSTVFAARVQQAMGLAQDNGGKFQITSYPTGKAYKAHMDCQLGGRDPRDRVASVLVYLNDVNDGGETKFPELGIWVKPRKGRALMWNNMSPEGLCEPHSLHEASKVTSGSKYILIRWYYYKSFYSLGKRPPEPSLPARAVGTPRVYCDDYDSGSCRWYDEWNNDHLLDYEYNKYTLI